MVVTEVMLSMIEIIISFVAAVGVYYIFSEQERKEKRKLLGEISSVLINFVLFIWLSKVILNFSMFVSDPLVILAYPSDAETFYLAFIFSSSFFVYQYKKKDKDAANHIEAFTMVFLIASIMYELIQFVWNNNESSFGYILLLAALLIIFIILQRRIKVKVLLTVVITLWSLGTLILINVYPLSTVFGYIIRPWFVAVFFIISILIVFFTVRKEDG